MIILSTGSLYTYGLSRVFAMAAEAGYDGIEVIVDHRHDTRDPRYLQRLSEQFGLPIVAVHTPFVMTVPDWPGDRLGQLHRTLELARQVGASVVVTHLPTRVHAIVGHWYGEQPRRFVLPVLWRHKGPYYQLLRDGDLSEMERAFGGVIAVENMPAFRILGLTLNPCWFNSPELLGRFRHLTMDTTHLGTWGLDPIAVYAQLKERIVHVHLANYDGREHRLPFDGHLPLADLLHHLARDGYTGAISVESQPDALGAEDEERTLRSLRQALEFCRKHFSIDREEEVAHGEEEPA